MLVLSGAGRAQQAQTRPRDGESAAHGIACLVPGSGARPGLTHSLWCSRDSGLLNLSCARSGDRILNLTWVDRCPSVSHSSICHYYLYPGAGGLPLFLSLYTWKVVT